MIIAMTIVRVMEPSIHEVIDMITMGHALVSAAWPMRMGTPGFRCAAGWIGVADLDDVFVNMILVHMMQMTIVEVIDVAVMAQSRVSAVRTMPMGMIGMMPLGAGSHGLPVYPRVLSTRSQGLGAAVRVMQGVMYRRRISGLDHESRWPWQRVPGPKVG